MPSSSRRYRYHPRAPLRSPPPSSLLLLLLLVAVLGLPWQDSLPTVEAFQLESDFIFTKEVTYCSTGRAVEVDRFDIRYYRENQTIGFDINARSVAPDLNADINIQLYAYGKNYINISADLCGILNGALCPLPEYQFDGSFAYILPDSVNIELPAIAYSVPDLDAYAQVILTNQATGAESVCLGATLSNGRTVYMNQVGWAAGGLAIGAFVAALIHSFWPLTPYKSGPEWRFATIITYYQHIALCGFLSLDYPLVYKSFTLNFAWAQGLIHMKPINDAINRMRLKTGGIDRTGQTFTVIAENSVQLATHDPASASSNARSFAALSVYTVPTVQEAPSYNLISGIETTAEYIGITYPNAFMTVFIVLLFLCCLMIAIFLLVLVGVLIYTKLLKRRASSARGNYVYFVWSNTIRTALLAYTPVVLFVFWQFLHEPDSGWLAVLIAVVTFLLLHVAIAGIYWHTSKLSTRALNSSQEKVSLRWSTVSKQFKRSGHGYLILLTVAAIVESAFVAFAQGRGLVQLVPLIAVEVIVFLTFCIWRPFANRGSNILMILISFFKVAAFAILVTFYYKIARDMNGIISAVLGFVILAIQSVMVVILFVVTVYNLGAGLLWARGSRRRAEEANRAMMAEKRDNGPLLNRSPSSLPPPQSSHDPPAVYSLYIPNGREGDTYDPTTVNLPANVSPETSSADSRTVVNPNTSASDVGGNKTSGGSSRSLFSAMPWKKDSTSSAQGV